MKTLMLVLAIFLFVPSAYASGIRPFRMTPVAGSSFHWSRPEAQPHTARRVERDGVISGNIKMSIMIVPVDSMIDPGMIDLIPGRNPVRARILLRSNKMILVEPR